MSEKYYGDVKVRPQGGSLIVTIPAGAVDDLSINAGDHLGVYSADGMLALVSPTERGDSDGTELP